MGRPSAPSLSLLRCLSLSTYCPLPSLSPPACSPAALPSLPTPCLSPYPSHPPHPAPPSYRALAVCEAAILLHPTLPLVGISIETMGESHQNDSLAEGYRAHLGRSTPRAKGALALMLSSPENRSSEISGSQTVTLRASQSSAQTRNRVRWVRLPSAAVPTNR